MGLWPHQAEGVEHAIRHRKVAWAHDTGVGKTRTAIELANALEAGRILIICPTIAVEHWMLQIDKWSDRDLSVAIVRSLSTSLAMTNVLIVTFNLLSNHPKLAKALAKYQFDLVVIDEAHALKEEMSIRTEAVYGLMENTGGLVRNAPYVVLLTATLMPNHPGELWTHLKALRPELLKEPGYDSFIDRYCVVKTTWRGSTPFERVVGARKGAPATDLKRRLLTFIHRVKKKDVQKDLPPFTLDVWPVHIDDLNVPEDLLREWRTAEAALLRSIGSATGEEALALARASPHSATQRRLTGVIKSAAMTAVLAAELEEPGKKKVIAFSYHRGVLEALARRFAGHGVVTIDGRTPPEQRLMLVRDFQTNSKVRLFNGQIVTAGESIDLTASSTMWIMESDWTPKTITQAIGRANRPGQTEPLTVRMLTLEGSIDTALARTLARKARDIEMIMEGV